MDTYVDLSKRNQLSPCQGDSISLPKNVNSKLPKKSNEVLESTLARIEIPLNEDVLEPNLESVVVGLESEPRMDILSSEIEV